MAPCKRLFHRLVVILLLFQLCELHLVWSFGWITKFKPVERSRAEYLQARCSRFLKKIKTMKAIFVAVVAWKAGMYDFPISARVIRTRVNGDRRTQNVSSSLFRSGRRRRKARAERVRTSRKESGMKGGITKWTQMKTAQRRKSIRKLRLSSRRLPSTRINTHV